LVVVVLVVDDDRVLVVLLVLVGGSWSDDNRCIAYLHNHSIGDDLVSTRGGVKDWSSELELAGSHHILLFLLHFCQSGNVACGGDEFVIYNKRSFVNTDDLDLRGVNSKGG